MIETIISLRPTMRRKLDFDHEFLDEIVKFYKVAPAETVPALKRYVVDRNQDDRYVITMTYMWMVKDMICRFRAHFPDTICMTDDLASVGIEAVTEYVADMLTEFTTQPAFFKKLQAFIHSRMRAYINDNRSAFGASKSTNERRQTEGQPLEYNFACEVSDDLMGTESNDPYLVDVLDAIEQLNEVDAEEMRDLVLQFLKQNHNIDEDELTDAERQSLEKLSEFVRNAGL